MKTLTEINAERNEIINEAIDNLHHSAIRGTAYTPEELSKLTQGIIPAENFRTNMAAGFWEIKRKAQRRWCGDRFYLYGRLRCRLVEDKREFTYKVYDEDGILVDTFTRYKRVIKAEIV